MPNSRSSALIRLVCAVCSLISRPRSRLARRASSCSGARHPHDPHHPRLAAQIRHQRAQHLLAVDPVGLRPPRPLIHRNARRVEHVVRDPGRHQQPMQPKPVVARLVAAHHRRHRSQLPAPPGRASDRSAPASRHDRRPPAYAATSGPCPGCASSPANSSGSVRSQRKSCHNGPRWACLRSMLASDSPMVRVWKPKPIGRARSPPHGIYGSTSTSAKSTTIKRLRGNFRRKRNED